MIRYLKSWYQFAINIALFDFTIFYLYTQVFEKSINYEEIICINYNLQIKYIIESNNIELYIISVTKCLYQEFTTNKDLGFGAIKS